MKIGIDCRMSGLSVGIGRYVDQLVEGLLAKDKNNEYVLITRADEPFTHTTACRVHKDNNRCRLVSTKAQHYSFNEQLTLPSLIRSIKVDLMHYPNFNTPVLSTTPYVITIHDLIKHFSRGKDTTTRQSWLYWLKYAGYHVGFYLSVKRAKKIIVPTKAVKAELEKFYSLPPEKVVVTYEGVGDTFIVNKQIPPETVKSVIRKYNITEPYLLYVGAVYPHKNVERLIDAVKLINQKYKIALQLVIVCGRSIFWDRLAKKVVEKQTESIVNLAGYVPDEELKVLYNQTLAFIFPTLAEGFGLPGLEAMAAGTPVICSNIPVLKEVYGDSAIYFNPLSVEDMAEKIISVIGNSDLRDNLIKKGNQCYPNYQWSKMVEETLRIYDETGISLRSGK